MSFYNNKIYMEDLHIAVNSSVDIEKLFGCSVMITGASGLIGSYLTDMLLLCNKERNADITIYAIDLSTERMKSRFEGLITDKLIFIEHNVNNAPTFDFNVDYIIHAASNAYPAVFNTDPVGTIMSNILGTKHLLDYGKKHNSQRLLYISSGEVYGQGDIGLDSFVETYSGYVDPTSARSCYPNGKRTAETLCVSYTKQYGFDTVIVRPSHTYGANATIYDNRANVQFVNNAVKGEDIVLNSAGKQRRSYTYIADTASAILTVLAKGDSCNAYNIANESSTATIAEFAEIVAKCTGVKVLFTNPDSKAKSESSPIAKQVLNNNKLVRLGWSGNYSVQKGISNIIQILTD